MSNYSCYVLAFMKQKNSFQSPRREPTQGRSRSTVDCILEASAHILVKEGLAKLNTNYIAEVAGVSVGSIYQYFGNKHMILVELGDRHIDEMLGIIVEGIGESGAQTLRDSISAIVDAVISAHMSDPELHKVLISELEKLEGYDRLQELEDTLIALASNFILQWSSEICVTDVYVSSFIVVTTIETLIHQGLLRTPALDHAVLKSECSTMIYRYLTSKDLD